MKAATTHRYSFINTYVADLANIIDFDVIRGSNLSIAVDPLGGAGVHYWPAIADRYKLNLKVLNTEVDPTFRFMTVDWDGKIRMDPSSPYAMQSLIHLKDRFDVAFACDTDHDRHGIVTRSAGLMQPNHFAVERAVETVIWPSAPSVGFMQPKRARKVNTCWKGCAMFMELSCRTLGVRSPTC